MTAQEAIERLEQPMLRVIDGKPPFKEIADVIREAQRLIGYFGTTGAERTDVILDAEKWLGLPKR